MDAGSANLFTEQQAETYLENFAAESHGVLTELAAYLNTVETPEHIYHYTNDIGFHGLISSGEVWLNDVYGMNDPTEVGHGIGIALDILKEPSKQNEKLRGIVRSMLHRYHEEGWYQSVSSVFVSSFSSKADDLSQWRAYADNGRGYALCFNARLLEQNFLDIPRDDCITGTFRISYNEDKCREFVQRIIDIAERYLIAAILLSDEHTSLFQKYAIAIISTLTTALYNISTGFKNPSYSAEDEFRFMLHYHRPVEAVEASVRTRPYQLIRYLKYPWKQLCREALVRVITGPSGGYQSERFANDIKRQYGFSELEIVRSKIPYRT